MIGLSLSVALSLTFLGQTAWALPAVSASSTYQSFSTTCSRCATKPESTTATASQQNGCQSIGMSNNLATSHSNYTVACGIDHPGDDLSNAPSASFAGCAEKCDALSECVGFSYIGGDGPGHCYFKSSIGAAVPRSDIDFASKAGPSRPTEISESSSTTSEPVTTFTQVPLTITRVKLVTTHSTVYVPATPDSSLSVARPTPSPLKITQILISTINTVIVTPTVYTIIPMETDVPGELPSPSLLTVTRTLHTTVHSSVYVTVTPTVTPTVQAVPRALETPDTSASAVPSIRRNSTSVREQADPWRFGFQHAMKDVVAGISRQSDCEFLRSRPSFYLTVSNRRDKNRTNSTKQEESAPLYVEAPRPHALASFVTTTRIRGEAAKFQLDPRTGSLVARTSEAVCDNWGFTLLDEEDRKSVDRFGGSTMFMTGFRSGNMTYAPDEHLIVKDPRWYNWLVCQMPDGAEELHWRGVKSQQGRLWRRPRLGSFDKKVCRLTKLMPVRVQ